MRLLFLTEYYPGPGETLTGGVETRAWQVTKELAKRHDVTVVTSRRAHEPRMTSHGRLRIARVGLAYPYSNEGYVMKRLCWAVSAFVHALRVDAHLVEGTSFLTYVPAALVGLVKRLPRIATYHETWVGGQWVRAKGWMTGGLGELWERLALRLPWTRIISVSEFTKGALVSGGVPESMIDVVPNGIDLSRFGADPRKSEHPTIACVSRLVATKRVDVLVRAIPAVAGEVPDVRATIVGAGDEERSLRELATSLGVDDRIAFLGRLAENRDVVRTIQRAQVFALPSESEGFGIVVLEAMACGVPVVCSDIPPLREVTGCRGALLFRPGDVDDLAEKLSALLADEEARARVGLDAAERARAFAWPELVDRIEAIYDEIVG